MLDGHSVVIEVPWPRQCCSSLTTGTTRSMGGHSQFLAPLQSCIYPRATGSHKSGMTFRYLSIVCHRYEDPKLHLSYQRRIDRLIILSINRCNIHACLLDSWGIHSGSKNTQLAKQTLKIFSPTTGLSIDRNCGATVHENFNLFVPKLLNADIRSK